MSYMQVSLKPNHCVYSPGNKTGIFAIKSFQMSTSYQDNHTCMYDSFMSLGVIMSLIGITKFNNQFQKRVIVAWILREDISVVSCYQDYRYSESLPHSDQDWQRLGLLHVHISLTQDVTNHILLLLKLKDLVHIFKYQKNERFTYHPPTCQCSCQENEILRESITDT